jgi:hypothetical protein
MLHIEHDKDETRHTYSQPHDIDRRMPFVSFDVSQCDFNIVFKHDKSPIKCRSDKKWQGLENLPGIPHIRSESAFFREDQAVFFFRVAQDADFSRGR